MMWRSDIRSEMLIHSSSTIMHGSCVLFTVAGGSSRTVNVCFELCISRGLRVTGGAESRMTIGRLTGILASSFDNRAALPRAFSKNYTVSRSNRIRIKDERRREIEEDSINIDRHHNMMRQTLTSSSCNENAGTCISELSGNGVAKHDALKDVAPSASERATSRLRSVCRFTKLLCRA
jgi:hypothetical protein